MKRFTLHIPTNSIILFAILSITISCKSEEKLIFSVEEIRTLSYTEMDKICDVLAKTNNTGRGIFNRNYKILEDEYLLSIGENLEQISAKHQAAKETFEQYTEINKRKHLEPIGFDREWYIGKNNALGDADSLWHMKPVEIDTEENRKSYFIRKYLIYRFATLKDFIIVQFSPMVVAPGFVPKKTFVINGKPVINYVGRGVIAGSAWFYQSVVKLWIDGIDINEHYDLQSAIMPCYNNDKLFFVFQKDDKWGWNYDGEMNYNIWDEVSHHFGGQGSIIPEIRRPDAYSRFTAIRDENYYTCKVVIKELSE